MLQEREIKRSDDGQNTRNFLKIRAQHIEFEPSFAIYFGVAVNRI